jgi:hypothetical protein
VGDKTRCISRSVFDNFMGTIKLIMLVSAMTLVVCRAEDGSKTQNWSTYTGAWFKIGYPADFLVVPLSKSSTATNGYDGVKFVNKEGVEFYVYSPQWSGKEMDYIKEIAANPATENMERQSTSARDYVVSGRTVETNAIVTRVVVITAKYSSRERTYEIQEDHVQSSRLIFGYCYPDQATFTRYKAVYDKFKQSLMKYAD